MFNIWDEAYFGDTPLGWEIAGDEETVQGLSDADVRDFWAAGYRPSNLVIAVAGDIGHDDAVELVDRTFGRGDGVLAGWSPAPAVPAERIRLEQRPTSQAHVCLGLAGLPRDHADQWALELLNTILGEGTSSRLFLKVREEDGLAYDVHSFQTDYSDCGLLQVYLGVDPDDVVPALRSVVRELARLRDEAVPQAELEKARNYTTGRLEMRLEESRAMASFLGGQEALHDRVHVDGRGHRGHPVRDRSGHPGGRGSTRPRRGALRRGHRSEGDRPWARGGPAHPMTLDERPDAMADEADAPGEPEVESRPPAPEVPPLPPPLGGLRRVRRPTQDAVSPFSLSGRHSPRPVPHPACLRPIRCPSSGVPLRAGSRTGALRPDPPATSRGSAAAATSWRTPPAASGWPTAAAARLGPTGRTAPPRWAGARRFSSNRAARSERVSCPWSRSASARPDAPRSDVARCLATRVAATPGDRAAARRCASSGRRDAACRADAACGADPACGADATRSTDAAPARASAPGVRRLRPPRGDGGRVGGAARCRRA